MARVERSDISNAIWLCGNCHKLVDDDPQRFPAGLLFEWQREHERRIASELGKTSTELRERYEKRHLQEFGTLSYLAERILTEKDDLWEYRLTAEVLRFEMAPILRRWEALKRNLYSKPLRQISKKDGFEWILTRNAEIDGIVEAFGSIANTEFGEAWGAKGIPGDEHRIVFVCRLWAEMCASALRWEEDLRFARIDEVFAEARDLYIGVAGKMIEEAARLPAYMSGLFGSDPKDGDYSFSMTLSLPDGWAEQLKAAMQRAADRIIADQR